jgi:CTP synthase (UTP-ammonia lyase)
MKIVVLGDFNPQYHTHIALNESIRHLTKAVNGKVIIEWRGTEIFDFISELKSDYSGLWIASGSPYKDPENVFNTIRYARENNIPTFGNCGGFQHMIIEYARNVCGITDADTEETNPEGKDLIISRLVCSLVGQEEDITIKKTSFLYSLIGKTHLIGRYHCSYAINPRYIPLLERGNMKMTATNVDGDIRAFEISSHPFYIGTLFQPALTSSEEKPNPILLGFVKHVLREIEKS